MANDLMRTGPRGTSNQAASVGPQQFTLKNTTTNLTVMVKANAETAVAQQGYFGTNWRVLAIQLTVTVQTVAPVTDIDIGTPGTVDAYVNGYALPAATAIGTVINVPLNGTAPTTVFGDLPSRPLLLTNAASANAGAYQVTVFAEPVSGRFYKD